MIAENWNNTAERCSVVPRVYACCAVMEAPDELLQQWPNYILSATVIPNDCLVDDAPATLYTIISTQKRPTRALSVVAVKIRELVWRPHNSTASVSNTLGWGWWDYRLICNMHLNISNAIRFSRDCAAHFKRRTAFIVFTFTFCVDASCILRVAYSAYNTVFLWADSGENGSSIWLCGIYRQMNVRRVVTDVCIKFSCGVFACDCAGMSIRLHLPWLMLMPLQSSFVVAIHLQLSSFFFLSNTVSIIQYFSTVRSDADRHSTLGWIELPDWLWNENPKYVVLNKGPWGHLTGPFSDWAPRVGLRIPYPVFSLVSSSQLTVFSFF